MSRVAVDQIRVSRAGHVEQVSRIHTHPVPLPTLGDDLAQPLVRVSSLLGEVREHRTLEVVVTLDLLELREDLLGVFDRPVREHDGVFDVVFDRVLGGGLDDQLAIMPELFLKSRVAVVPIRAALSELEFVGEGLTRRDSFKADSRHTIHVEWQEDAMPVDGCRFVEVVVHTNMRRLSFLHTDHRAREGAVVCDHLSSPSTDLAPFSADMKVDSSWRGGIQRCPGGVSSLSGPRQPGKDPQHSGRDASLKESASCPCRTWGLLAHLMSCPLKKRLPASAFCEGFCNDRVPRGDRIESTSHAMLFRAPKPHEQGV